MASTAPYISKDKFYPKSISASALLYWRESLFLYDFYQLVWHDHSCFFI